MDENEKENSNSLQMNKIDEIKNFNSIINDSKLLINKEIHKFLFFLLKNIFLGDDSNTQINRYLKKWINNINSKIIKRKSKYISFDYSIENFKNILCFTKSQNKKYAGDIIEDILIIIFSKGFNIDKDKSFTKYIYYNFNNLDKMLYDDLSNCFNYKIFRPKELEDIKFLFYLERNNSVIYNLLLDIFLIKYFKPVKLCKYRDIIEYHNSFLNYSSKAFLKRGIHFNDSDILGQNSNPEEVLSFNNPILDDGYEEKKVDWPQVIRAFFISVYIYYQNKNSPLMKYIKPNFNSTKNESELAYIPFEFNLSQAEIEERFAPIIFAPLRIEPRITKIVLPWNSLGKFGLNELFKTLLFNKRIKSIDYSHVLSHSYEFPFVDYGFGMFQDHSVEELNLSSNFINSNCEENIAELLRHFKRLKTLIFLKNEVGNGFSWFFILLKKLYKKRKIKLENLFFNKCRLDEASLYELGELLKCKYCQLKKLSIVNNGLPYNIHFLKKIKYNKSLEELHLSRDDISDDEASNILKIMSNSNINHLYLGKNKFYIFSNFLKILSRTKIIKDKNEKKIKSNHKSLLMNLDMSNINYFWKNAKQIQNFSKIIKNTSLECLDISHILYGSNPNLMPVKKENVKYREEVEYLRENLVQYKNNYVNIKREIINNQADIKELEDFEDILPFEYLDDKISSIINNKNADSSIFLRENSRRLINEEKTTIIRQNIYINNEDEMNVDEIEQKLVKYMTFKKAKENIKVLKKELKNRKLIII